MIKSDVGKLEFEKPNVFIREYYIDENGHEQERMIDSGNPISSKEENNQETKEKITIEEFNDFMNKLIEKHQEIKLRDNKKNIAYTISKDDNSFNIKIEKSIKYNDNVNNLFERLKEYIDSVGDSNEYWPSSESEYPDLMILWEIIAKFNNETNKLNGALKYPDNWEQMLLEIRKQVVNVIDETNN